MSAPAARADLFGHPRGLTYLFTTEMLGALFVLWDALAPCPLHDEISAAGRSRRQCHRPSDRQARARRPIRLARRATVVVADLGVLYALVYFTPIFGGLLADRVLGQRRTVIVGAVLMAIGHFMMAVEPLFLFALLALILGSGCFKPNISTQVGGLYAPGDHRRDRAYRSSMSASMSARFWAPLICGTLGEEAAGTMASPPPASACASGFRFISMRSRNLPADELHKAKAAHVAHRALDRDEWRAVNRAARPVRAQHVVLATYEQMGNTMILWADANTDRTVRLVRLSMQIPPPGFLAFNPFMDFRFHAVRRRAVDASGRARDRAVDHHENGRSAASALRRQTSS